MRIIAIVLVFVLVSACAQAQETMAVATVKAIKDATVFIRTHFDSEPENAGGSGSGFLIRAEGTTGYVATNYHVISSHRSETEFKKRTTEVYFRSGSKAEIKVVAEVVAESPERDLAILKVTGVKDLPAMIDLNSDVEPFETMTIYIFGFPFGSALAEGKGNPPVTVGRGQVSSIRRDRQERLKSVLIDGALNPGNSGGPVVDTKGRLVGVSVAAIRGANIGFAIGVPQLHDTLRGEPEGANLSFKRLGPGGAELAIDIPLFDPLDKVKTVKLLYTSGEAKFSQVKRSGEEENGKAAEVEDEKEDGLLARVRKNRKPEWDFGPIEGARTAGLSVANHRASGSFHVPGAGKDLILWCQVAYVDATGKTVHSQPLRNFLSDDGASGLKLWGEVVDPDGDCQLKLERGEVLVEVPGTLHDLNIDIRKNNAPRVVQEVDGDFVAAVKVMGSFHPGAGGTSSHGVPYNGGGITIWLDEGNNLRLDRAAMFRNNRVLGFLAFESREQGARAQVHNKGGTNPNQDLWLKLERRGKTLTGAFSKDNRDWEELGQMDLDWPARVKVGLDSINTCSDPLTVRFQDYSLKKRITPAPATPR